jgi:hypothetical protein
VSAGFTPGPWYVLDQRASTQRSQGFVIPGHDAILISSYAPNEIRRGHCDCIIARIDFSNRPEELGESNFATARLIAAAPSLFNAATLALDYILNRVGNDAAETVAVSDLRAAIAKARGETL